MEFALGRFLKLLEGFPGQDGELREFNQVAHSWNPLDDPDSGWNRPYQNYCEGAKISTT